MSFYTSTLVEMGLYEKNHPRQFWKVADIGFTDADWSSACQSAISFLSDLLPQNTPCDDPIDNVLCCVLGEEQFGPDHWKLNLARKLFYQLKPLIPRPMQLSFDKVYRSNMEIDGGLRWPIEDRYVLFQSELLRVLLREKRCSQVPYIHFWRHGKRFALVLTHDVETADGFKAIPRIVELEKQYGFRSLLNIVPKRYSVDKSYLEYLRAEGFEIGIHGLKHDGKLFRTRKGFEQRARRINAYLEIYNASGFRAPLMHRHPVWMQALECEYDLSFFDTDPYEGIPGGCMSVWPFFIGHFVELPYTLAQDHTLMMTSGETTPQLWIEKVDFIEQHYGMALLNSHPDYLVESDHLRIYEAFLKKMNERDDRYWHALPREVARWWKARNAAAITQDGGGLSIRPAIPGASVGTISISDGQMDLDVNIEAGHDLK